MTFDECQQDLVAIRRQQGTRFPLIRIDCGGSVYKGRLARTDSDPEHREAVKDPYGIIVLEEPTRGRSQQTILQIASLPGGSIKALGEREDRN